MTEVIMSPVAGSVHVPAYPVSGDPCKALSRGSFGVGAAALCLVAGGLAFRSDQVVWPVFWLLEPFWASPCENSLAAFSNCCSACRISFSGDAGSSGSGISAANDGWIRQSMSSKPAHVTR